jgi:apyrase
MENWKETQIHLMATAGLRHIEQHLSESIIDACRETLRESPFSFEKDEWASVLPGTKEASYGWTAVNYAFNALSPEKTPKETYGVLELGGASMQVTYAVPHATAKNVVQKKHKETVRVGNSVKHLYASSLLGLGHEAARAEYHAMLRREYETTGEKPNNPCTNRGWTPQTTVQHGEALAVGAGPSKPTGNFTACYAMTKKLLGLAENTKDCPRTPCGMRKEHLPPFDGKFLATENFHYTAEFFKLGTTTTIRDFQRAGEKLCAESWGDVVKKRFRKDQKKWEEIDLSKYCFSAAFIVAMLKDGMLLPEDLKFTVGNNVGRYNVDWAMGAAINIISSKIAAASILTPDNSVGRSASASASDIAAAAGLAPSSASSHTHEANDMFWWCVYILAGFFGCSKFVFSGVWEMLYFKCVSIVRRTRENRRRLRNARRNGDSDNSRCVGRRGSRSGSDGSSLIGGGGGLRRNGSRSLSSSVSNLRGSFNRSQSGFLTSLPSRKGSFHDLSDIDSLV